MLNPKIITISGKATHGKDAAATMIKEELEQRGYKVVILHYADLLKHIAKTYYGWDGNKDEKGRSLLQYLGTEKVRSHKPDFWVHLSASIITTCLDDCDYVIIPDTRFPNEIQFWISADRLVECVKVVRPNAPVSLTPEQMAHPSETALDNFDFDRVIVANDLFELRAGVINMMTNYPVRY